jgi:hypothetical protein
VILSALGKHAFCEFPSLPVMAFRAWQAMANLRAESISVSTVAAERREFRNFDVMYSLSTLLFAFELSISWHPHSHMCDARRCVDRAALLAALLASF